MIRKISPVNWFESSETVRYRQNDSTVGVASRVAAIGPGVRLWLGIYMYKARITRDHAYRGVVLPYCS